MRSARCPGEKRPPGLGVGSGAAKNRGPEIILLLLGNRHPVLFAPTTQFLPSGTRIPTFAWGPIGRRICPVWWPWPLAPYLNFTKKSTPQLAGQLALYRTRTPKWGVPHPTTQPHTPCRPTPPNKCSLGLVWAFGRGERISPVHGKLGMYLRPSPGFYRQAAPARQPLPGGCGGQLAGPFAPFGWW